MSENQTHRRQALVEALVSVSKDIAHVCAAAALLACAGSVVEYAILTGSSSIVHVGTKQKCM